MSIEDFKRRLAACKAIADLERLAAEWYLIQMLESEREGLRGDFCRRWDEVASRQGILVASEMGTANAEH